MRRSFHLCEYFKLWPPFLERGIFIHFIRQFICAVRLFIVVRLIISASHSFHLCECLWPPFLERGIFIHFIRLICAVGMFIVVRLIICERRSFHLCECLWPPFLERGMFIHFIRLFIICAVSDRRDPRQLGDSSRIVTIRQLFQG